MFKGQAETLLTPVMLRVLLTAIYHINDWNREDLNGRALYRVEVESIADDGSISVCKKDDGTSIYHSLHNGVESWVLNINVYIDHKMESIRARIIDM